ncbi:MAG: hypothetical protein R3264_12435, partial [Anaerolineae bacterium]|nr:hypothetical protein [Anaerolineae bacterium]
WTTFTDPEVAHVGLTEVEAREKFGPAVTVSLWPIDRVDRAVSDGETDGFVKVVHKKNGKILGATIVAARAGEIITEYAIALKHNLKLLDLAQVIHPYPTYSIANMQLAGEAAVQGILDGPYGDLIINVAKLVR